MKIKVFSLFALGILVFTSFFIVHLVFATTTDSPTFSDVGSFDTNYPAIEYLVSVGALEGYTDGTFKPDQTVNRAELMKILVAGQQIDPDDTTYRNCFTDVGTEWYAQYVCYAKEQGWVSGYADGGFKPGQIVNKVEAVKMVLHAFNLQESLPSTVTITLFDDTDSEQWYGPYLFVAKNMNLLDVSSGDFNPSGAMDRGWVSEYVFRAWILDQMEADEYDTDVRDAFFTVKDFSLYMPARSTLFATMLAFQSGNGFAGDSDLEALATESWHDLRDDDVSWETFLDNLDTQFSYNTSLVEKIGFSSNRDVVAAFAWNVIEPSEGEFDWDLSDTTMKFAGSAGVALSAVIQPYSSWGSPDTVSTDTCHGIDFAFLNYAGGLPSDLDAYTNFLTQTVERYDGDGEDDMPGLTTRVEAWEVSNEVEGPCSGSLSDAETYLELLKVSYAAIKEADSDALVLNAGALEIIGSDGNEIASTKEFWETFFANGGADYLDIFNFHYNRERNAADDDLLIWLEHLDFFRDLLDESAHEDTSLWITEYGTFGGDIDVPKSNGTSEELTKTDDEQSAWYFRTVVTGMAYGIERFFIDLSGADGSGIGSSSLYEPGGDERAFVATLKALDENLADFDSVVMVDDGQYVFIVGDTTVYALWDGTLPSNLSGTVTVINLDGSSDTVDASEVSYSEDAPVLVVQ